MKAESSIGLFADGLVGNEALIYLLENYFNDVKWIVLKDKESMLNETVSEYSFDLNNLFFSDELKQEKAIDKLKGVDVEYALLAWWPYIIKEPIISLPKIGVLNFHPSLLPYNRGKHYNFWTIIENTPFGVSIHFVDPTIIDGGDILFQKNIDKEWTDTGETLYFKAQKAMIELFKETYPEIRKGNYIRKKQDLSIGSFHKEKELDPASEIILDNKYEARELINILRARTFIPYPAAWFEENGSKYEVRITIKKLK